MTTTPRRWDRLLMSPELYEQELAAAEAAGQELFEGKLNAAPQAIACSGRHEGLSAVLDRPASREAAQLVYTCKACVLDKGRAQFLARQVKAGIPEGLRHARLSATHTTFQTVRPHVRPDLDTPGRFLECARELLAWKVRNFIGAGPVGTGKSHLCAAIANQRLWQGLRVKWVSYSQMFDDLAATRERPAPWSRAQLIRLYALPSLLVIDELGIKQVLTDTEQVFLFDVMEARDQADKQTIATTNIPGSELATRIGDRPTDRFQSGGLHFCYGSWESMRGAAAEAE